MKLWGHGSDICLEKKREKRIELGKRGGVWKGERMTGSENCTCKGPVLGEGRHGWCRERS